LPQPVISERITIIPKVPCKQWQSRAKQGETKQLLEFYSSATAETAKIVQTPLNKAVVALRWFSLDQI